MKIFTGGGSSKRTRKVLRENGIGEMLTKPQKEVPALWAFDNGVFACWQQQKPFDTAKFLRWIEAAYRNYPRPYLAVLPDKVGEGMASFEFSFQWLKMLRESGYGDWPWYLALQDGMESACVIAEMDDLAGLFLGGTDDFKKQAGYWKKIAIHNGKPFHYARAGTLSKLAHAIMIGADSVDSTFPLWTKDRLFSFIQALSQQQFPQELLIFEKLPKWGEGSYTQVRP